MPKRIREQIGTVDLSEDDPLPRKLSALGEDAVQVAIYGDWLQHVAERTDAVYHLSHLLDGVGRRVSNRSGVLTPNQCRFLLERVRLARKKNPSMFWEDTAETREITRQGFDALETLINIWAEDEHEQRRRSAESTRDAFDYARIFQNLMHNISLAEAIEARAHKRISEDVARIRLLAIGGVS